MWFLVFGGEYYAGHTDDWVGKSKGWPERNRMNGRTMTMNGMERKVVERSLALECNGEMRKPLAVALVACTLDEWWGFLLFMLATAS